LIWLSLSALAAFQLLAAGWVLCLAPGGHVRTESPAAPCSDAGTECHDLPLFSVTPFARADGSAPSPAPALTVEPVAFGIPDGVCLALAGPGRNPAPPPPARLAPVLLI
jgi:hypothetical protein